ncbi:MAG: hypothetical protein JEY96_00845 [Bacteroidales bacterium]|nr:hypothetical protein [Bacteroidales bacterium]
MNETEHNTLVNNGEFHLDGCQYTIMYMSRIHSLAEFLFAKILSLRGKIYSDYEASEIMEAFAVKTICDWEWYIERMIYECLKSDTTKLAEQLDLNLPKTISTDECAAYLNGLGYIDLKNASNLKSISKKILVDSNNPFVKMDNEAKSHIDDFYIFRNYVAHRSNKSKQSLQKVYKKYNQNKFIEVGEFLMNKIQSDKKPIRFQEFGSAFWMVSFNIMEFLYPKTFKWIAQEEKVYNEKCHLRLHYLMSLSPNKPK